MASIRIAHMPIGIGRLRRGALSAKQELDLGDQGGCTASEPQDLRLPLVLTVKETAQLLRCSQEIVYELIYSGQLRALRPSRRFMIPRAALDAFLGGSYKVDS